MHPSLIVVVDLFKPGTAVVSTYAMNVTTFRSVRLLHNEKSIKINRFIFGI